MIPPDLVAEAIEFLLSQSRKALDGIDGGTSPERHGLVHPLRCHEYLFVRADHHPQDIELELLKTLVEQDEKR